jgi:hypothetical protein
MVTVIMILFNDSLSADPVVRAEPNIIEIAIKRSDSMEDVRV